MAKLSFYPRKGEPKNFSDLDIKFNTLTSICCSTRNYWRYHEEDAIYLILPTAGMGDQELSNASTSSVPQTESLDSRSSCYLLPDVAYHLKDDASAGKAGLCCGHRCGELMIAVHSPFLDKEQLQDVAVQSISTMKSTVVNLWKMHSDYRNTEKTQNRVEARKNLIA
ncbi:hypothetical protein STEG23_013619 [Scotinomys teguina]